MAQTFASPKGRTGSNPKASGAVLMRAPVRLVAAAPGL